ncbi:hypothetical protein ACQKP0_06760 [Heyndrickxia sp. NPDC080065]|uniref:hypothetical protein n=1 Tax=Heyndrickxia sp. NPDC080065 TaxID=3390568 RepID=UPI003D063324
MIFDPTAFENMKVVLEGATYDLDLGGKIRVVNRKDIVDLATLSRLYEITYSLYGQASVFATISLEAKLNQLASEILKLGNQSHFGVFATISYSWELNEKAKQYFKIIKDHWGPDYTYDERRIFSSLHGTKEEIKIDFTRLITEDMIDDVVEMLHYSVEILGKLR